MLYLWLCLASGLWFIYKDQNNNLDFLSAFTWHLSALLIIFILPGIIEYGYGFCLYGIKNRCSEEAVVFSARLLLLQILCVGSTYLIFKKVTTKTLFNYTHLTIINNKIVYLLTGIYFISFIDLFLAWLKHPSWGGLYENMKGHGWANHLTFPLGTILGILLLASFKHRKTGIIILALQLIYTTVFLDRKTQAIQLLFCILWVVFYHYRSLPIYKTLSKFVVSGLWLISLSILFILFLEDTQWYASHEILHKIRVYISYNLGHFYILALSYQNMPSNFRLSPMILSRAIPYYAYFPQLNQWSITNDSIVEDWMYGAKLNVAGGFPFLSILKQYLSLGYSGVFIFSFFWGLVFSQVIAPSTENKPNNKTSNIYPGIFALFWTYFLGLGIPSLQFPLLLLIVLILICFPFSEAMNKLRVFS